MILLIIYFVLQVLHVHLHCRYHKNKNVDLVKLGATVTSSWPDNHFISVVYVTGQNNIQVKIFNLG